MPSAHTVLAFSAFKFHHQEFNLLCSPIDIGHFVFIKHHAFKIAVKSPFFQEFAARTSFLKEGELHSSLKGHEGCCPDERPKVYQWVNETREAVEKLLLMRRLRNLRQRHLSASMRVEK